MKDLSDKSLKFAVVGLGKMGLLHTSILNVLPNVEVIALCEKSFIARKFLKKMFSRAVVVDDVEKLSDLELDAVHVTTPIFSHFPVVRSIYLNRIACNVFVEKTLASSYEKAEELCRLAGRFGNASMVGYTRRFAVTFQKARDLLHQNTVGEAIAFKAYAYSSDFPQTKKSERSSEARGGVLRDLGCHALDLALWFFSDLEVESARFRSASGDGFEDSAFCQVKTPNGVAGAFNASRCMKGYRMPEVGLSITCSKGVIDVNDDKLKLNVETGKSFTWHRHDLHDNVSFSLGGPEYFRENAYFVKSVARGGKVEPSFDTASKVDRIIDQIESNAD